MFCLPLEDGGLFVVVFVDFVVWRVVLCVARGGIAVRLDDVPHVFSCVEELTACHASTEGEVAN